MTPDQITIGELARVIKDMREEQKELAEDVRGLLVPIGVLQSQMQDIKPKVEHLWWNAAVIAGGTSVGVWVLARWIK